ncbi:hypothetical protein [Roseibium litorale]|uniref:Uncharacterized protein n=1 Tax=Roseibium litorale TaxID=2803841 RepID=A0ABR9CJZ8_9HYPH|nr:hypothetical protein [Roseibium litorale]MBD8890894.1 hypothetical protein [Roseibium litorale]
MSLESSITDLTAAHTQLADSFRSFQEDAKAALAEALLVTPTTIRAYHVDQINGSDAGEGTAADPFQSLGKATSLGVQGGVLKLMVHGTYFVSEGVYFPEGVVELYSDNAVTGRIVFGNLRSDNPAEMPRFYTAFTGARFFIHDITLVAGTAPDGVGQRHMIACHGHTTAVFVSAVFDLPEGSNQNIFQLAHGVGFVCQDCTFPASGMGGRWIEAVPAGTAHTEVRQLSFTNVGTL